MCWACPSSGFSERKRDKTIVPLPGAVNDAVSDLYAIAHTKNDFINRQVREILEHSKMRIGDYPVQQQVT